MANTLSLHISLLGFKFINFLRVFYFPIVEYIYKGLFLILLNKTLLLLFLSRIEPFFIFFWRNPFNEYYLRLLKKESFLSFGLRRLIFMESRYSIISSSTSHYWLLPFDTSDVLLLVSISCFW